MSDHARRTFASYKRQVLHALGNPDEGELDISPGAIVNDALEHIAAMHPWRWLSTNEVALSLVGGQTYVELPADFGAMIAIAHSEGWSNQLMATTWDQLLYMRRSTIEGWSGGYWYTIAMGNVEQGEEDAGLSLPTLELYPTPSSDAADAIRLVYRRFLRRMQSDDDRPQWPAYMDRPLSLLARGFASTDYDDDPQSAYTVEFSRLVDDCMAQDGLSVGSFGIPHGAVHQRHPAVPFGYPINGIPDPTTL